MSNGEHARDGSAAVLRAANVGTMAHRCVLRHRDEAADDGAARGETRTVVPAEGSRP